jgi:hypothetical protein
MTMREKTLTPIPASVPISLPVQAGMFGTGIACRIAHRSRMAGQMLQRPDLGIAGGYHCGNLGDMALGEAVRLQALKHFRKPELQTIYDLHRWPRAPSLVVGGGAVAYAEPLAAIAELYRDTPERVALLGVDFNDPEALERHKDFYARVHWIGCRSSSQAEMLRAMLPGASVNWTYDLVFSLVETAQARQAAMTPFMHREKIFGFNMVPFFVKRAGARFVPGTSYAKELQRDRPDLVGRVDDLAGAYVDWMRKAVREMQDAGYRVMHVPFTPQDDSYARSCLRGLDVEYRRYQHAPLTVLEALGRCRFFLTSRYHSLIFSLITATPVVAFEYASKCSRLLDDLNIETNRRSWDDILSTKQPQVVEEAERSPAFLTPDMLAEITNPLLQMMDLTLQRLVQP